MNADPLCPQCHAPLPPDAPAGLCPRCLLRSVAGLGEPAPSGAEVDFPDIGDPADVARRLPQFEILELLGKGGMGVVYKARQPQLDRLVALKILPPLDALSPDFVERFRREARALAKLSHPHIVAVHEFGEHGGLYYFAMEYVDGANLRSLLESKTLTAAAALAIVPRVCDALEYAHGEGVIHRDIKPENLLIDKKGRVKIADFGLAKLLQREPLEVSLTLSGTSLGTLRYMAPEQMEKPESVDHRADIYSLGVVIYEMLTGEVPMGRFVPPSEKARIDVRLDEIVLRSLERDVERRYQHASEVKHDVENVTDHPAAPTTASGDEWLVQCVNCGHTKPLAEAGGVRIGGGTSGTKRIPIRCSNCGGSLGTIVRGGTATAPSSAAAAESPRLSRTALWGAIWGMLGPIFVAPMLLISYVSRDANPVVGAIGRWEAALAIPFVLIGLAAPFGATILGGLAIGQIKRSNGKLHGLPLAVADLLFYPLLGFTALVMALTGYFLTALPGGGSPGPLPCLLAGLIASGFAARFVWRQISGQAPAAEPASGAPQPRPVLAAALVLGAIVTLFLGLSFEFTRQQTAAGLTSALTIGAFDPWFVRVDHLSGFRHAFHYLSWSLFALLAGATLVRAALRVNREDDGKVARDPVWWRNFFLGHGALLALFLVPLLLRGTPPPVSAALLAARAVPTPAPVLDAKTRGFEDRLAVALEIRADQQRHDVLEQIALDAATQGIAFSAKNAVEKMSFTHEHDDTAARCARLLAPQDLPGAFAVARLIRDNSLRDQTLGAITKPAATPAVER